MIADIRVKKTTDKNFGLGRRAVKSARVASAIQGHQRITQNILGVPAEIKVVKLGTELFSYLT
jgi:hypothetical protein